MKRIQFLLLFFTFVTASQIFAQSKQQYGNIGNFKLENGQTIQNCRIGYRTYGQLNKSQSNVIIIPTWFGGTTNGLAGLVGPGNLADSTKYYVITLDALGDGVSSSPSTSKNQPGSIFPEFTIRDMVKSQHILLTQNLHIHHVYAVMGISMGGMQTFQWITAYPGFMDKGIPIVGSPRLTSYDLLLWTAELRAINEGIESQASEESIMKTVDAIHTMNLYTPSYRRDHTSRTDFKKFMNNSDKYFNKTFNPFDWASQLRAMMAQNVAKPFGGSMKKAAQSVKAQVLIIPSKQDHMVNPGPAIHFANLIHARVLELKNNCGHIATSCASAKMDKKVNQFLEN
ncbi:MAG TPA: alpha/beta fold hydrolase [Balneolales bacterium]|nr:alpha/beta fold hydrolase [Balneolales bacterium]